MEVNYCDRHYRTRTAQGIASPSTREKLLQIPEEEEFFVKVSMQDRNGISLRRSAKMKGERMIA